MKIINVKGIIVSYDLKKLANELKNIIYDRQNYIDNHRTPGDGKKMWEHLDFLLKINLVESN